MPRTLLATALLALVIVSPAIADIHMVWPDGSGLYPNIQAAIDASAQNDTIMLIEGWFSGPGNRNLQIPGSRTFIGFGEPGSNVIDAEGEPLGAMVDDDDPEDLITFTGITFRDGSRFMANSDDIVFERCNFELCDRVIHVSGYISTVGSVSMTDCVVSGCQGAPLVSANSVSLLRTDFEYGVHMGGGGASLVQGYGLAAEECAFLGNSDEGTNTALLLAWGTFTHPSGATVRDCEFTGNAAGYLVASIFGNILVEDCLFQDNLAHCLDLYGIEPWPGHLAEVRDCVFLENYGAGILVGEVDLVVEGCTFAHGGGLAEIVVDSMNPWLSLTIDRSLIVFRPAGWALQVLNEMPTMMVICTNIFGLADGDWVGPIGPHGMEIGNLSENPLFCHWPNRDLTLFDTSPCLPDNNECGVQIGAFGQGCVDLTAVENAPGFEARLAAHPNPFNPTTRLDFSLPAAGSVTLTVHDAAGRRVATLLDAEHRGAGAQHVDWHAGDLPSGVYLARLSGPKTHSAKLILLR